MQLCILVINSINSNSSSSNNRKKITLYGGRRRGSIRCDVDFRLNAASVDEILLPLLLGLRPAGFCQAARDLHAILCETLSQGCMPEEGRSHTAFHIRDMIQKLPLRVLVKCCGLPDALLGKLRKIQKLEFKNKDQIFSPGDYQFLYFFQSESISLSSIRKILAESPPPPPPPPLPEPELTYPAVDITVPVPPVHSSPSLLVDGRMGGKSESELPSDTVTAVTNQETPRDDSSKTDDDDDDYQIPSSTVNQAKPVSLIESIENHLHQRLRQPVALLVSLGILLPSSLLPNNTATTTTNSTSTITGNTTSATSGCGSSSSSATSSNSNVIDRDKLLIQKRFAELSLSLHGNNKIDHQNKLIEGFLAATTTDTSEDVFDRFSLLWKPSGSESLVWTIADVIHYWTFHMLPCLTGNRDSKALRRRRKENQDKPYLNEVITHLNDDDDGNVSDRESEDEHFPFPSDFDAHISKLLGNKYSSRSDQSRGGEGETGGESSASSPPQSDLEAMEEIFRGRIRRQAFYTAKAVYSTGCAKVVRETKGTENENTLMADQDGGEREGTKDRDKGTDGQEVSNDSHVMETVELEEDRSSSNTNATMKTKLKDATLLETFLWHCLNRLIFKEHMTRTEKKKEKEKEKKTNQNTISNLNDNSSISNNSKKSSHPDICKAKLFFPYLHFDFNSLELSLGSGLRWKSAVARSSGLNMVAARMRLQQLLRKYNTARKVISYILTVDKQLQIFPKFNEFSELVTAANKFLLSCSVDVTFGDIRQTNRILDEKNHRNYFNDFIFVRVIQTYLLPLSQQPEALRQLMKLPFKAVQRVYKELLFNGWLLNKYSIKDRIKKNIKEREGCELSLQFWKYLRGEGISPAYEPLVATVTCGGLEYAALVPGDRTTIPPPLQSSQELSNLRRSRTGVVMYEMSTDLKSCDSDEAEVEVEVELEEILSSMNTDNFILNNGFNFTMEKERAAISNISSSFALYIAHALAGGRLSTDIHIMNAVRDMEGEGEVDDTLRTQTTEDNDDEEEKEKNDLSNGQQQPHDNDNDNDDGGAEQDIADKSQNLISDTISKNDFEGKSKWHGVVLSSTLAEAASEDVLPVSHFHFRSYQGMFQNQLSRIRGCVVLTPSEYELRLQRLGTLNSESTPPPVDSAVAVAVAVNEDVEMEVEIDKEKESESTTESCQEKEERRIGKSDVAIVESIMENTPVSSSTDEEVMSAHGNTPPQLSLTDSSHTGGTTKELLVTHNVTADVTATATRPSESDEYPTINNQIDTTTTTASLATSGSENCMEFSLLEKLVLYTVTKEEVKGMMLSALLSNLERKLKFLQTSVTSTSSVNISDSVMSTAKPSIVESEVAFSDPIIDSANQVDNSKRGTTTDRETGTSPRRHHQPHLATAIIHSEKIPVDKEFTRQEMMDAVKRLVAAKSLVSIQCDLLPNNPSNDTVTPIQQQQLNKNISSENCTSKEQSQSATNHVCDDKEVTVTETVSDVSDSSSAFECTLLVDPMYEVLYRVHDGKEGSCPWAAKDVNQNHSRNADLYNILRAKVMDCLTLKPGATFTVIHSYLPLLTAMHTKLLLDSLQEQGLIVTKTCSVQVRCDGLFQGKNKLRLLRQSVVTDHHKNITKTPSNSFYFINSGLWK